MSERNEMGGRSGRQPAEGVRIIRAEEARAALEAGEAAGRRPDDQLRFGDVPPVPSGPRPAHRFPLPDSVNPAEAVSLPPLATPRHSDDAPAWTPPERETETWRPADQETWRPADQETWDAPEADTWRASGAETWKASDADETRQTRIPDPHSEPGAHAPQASTWEPESGPGWEPGDRTTEMDAPAPRIPDEGITVSGGAPEMPHWTDPPTGEVPRLRIEDDPEDDDDLRAWRSLGSRGVRWRDEDDWDDAGEISELVGDDEPVGVLDSSRSERSDIYSFDEDFQRVTSRPNPVVDLNEDEPDPEPELAAAPAGTHRQARQGRSARAARPAREASRPTPEPERAARRPGPGRTPPPAGGSDMGGRIAVGAGLIALLIICYAIGSKALVVLAGVVVVAAAAEAYGMLRGAGFRPATLLGLIATAGLIGGAYWKGIGAIPIVTVLLFAGAMMWYVLGIVEARPLANVAVSVMVFVWVGVLGAFAPVMLAVRHGQGLFLGAVVVAVAADICAFAVGRWFGRRPIAEHISPNKTLEGFVGGFIGAVIAGLIIGKELSPWGGMKHGLLLGVVIGLIAPAGDLFESMMKRDLGIKDSGQVLAGHGGLLDRFDSILLALPAAYFVATWFKL